MEDINKSFTSSLEKLQKAAGEITKQTTSLEDSIRLFEEGMKEAKFCEEILYSAEQKIELYREDDE